MTSSLLQPPMAKRVRKTSRIHGETRQDPYAWLRDKAHPEVVDHLKAENAYTEKIMRPTKALQKQLFQEMKSRIQETDITAPEKFGNYYYYAKTIKGKQYTISCRKRGSLKAKEEVILDRNVLARGKPFCSVGKIRISPNQRLVAYTVDFSGNEVYALHVKDLDTGRVIDEAVTAAYADIAWAADNQTLFYTVLDHAHRAYRVYRHVTGTAMQDDVLVFEELDERFSVRVKTSKSQTFVLIGSESNVTSEWHVIDAAQPTAVPWCFQARKQGVEYQLSHQGDRFFVLTNQGAKDFKVLSAPLRVSASKTWVEILAHEPGVTRESLEVFQNYLVVFERRKGMGGICVIDTRTMKRHQLAFPERVRTVMSWRRREYLTDELIFAYESFVTPYSVYEYNMATRRLRLKKQHKIHRFQANRYTVEQLWVPTKDGVRVPISLVYKKGLKHDRTNPCLLYGYGSYGICMDPVFSAHRLSLLDRGVIYAVAHIRGGADLGRAWYESGKYLNKKKTFDDFIACAEYLIKKKYTSPERLAIRGGSAGGLLMGAVTNLRPDLFSAVIADVPFVDVVNTMLDASLPLTVREYEEWGNPNELKYYHAMRAYSPYDNVEAKAYPPMLVTAGLNDPRVSYWEPAKWVAKLRALKTDASLLLLKTEMDAGHGGPSGRYAYLQEMAFQYAFLFKIWGIKKPLS